MGRSRRVQTGRAYLTPQRLVVKREMVFGGRKALRSHFLYPPLPKSIETVVSVLAHEPMRRKEERGMTQERSRGIGGLGEMRKGKALLHAMEMAMDWKASLHDSSIL
jgi:hypothetical protein